MALCIGVSLFPLCAVKLRFTDGGRIVRHYRCYFIETDDVPAAWRAFQCESDKEAHDYALGLFVVYPHAKKVEVWESTRLTFSYSRPMAHTSEDLRKLCYLAIAAAKKEIDERTKQALAARAFALAQEAEALERL